MAGNSRRRYEIVSRDGSLFDSNPSPTGGGYTIADAEGILISRRVIRKAGHRPG